MGLDPRIEQIRQAVARRPDLSRSHFRMAYGVGAKKLDEWCAAGLLDIPKRKPVRQVGYLFKGNNPRSTAPRIRDYDHFNWE